ncbi:RDD family protein [Helicobacter sp. MIT 05-5294]|uniref:RDD family protein n=1 Tax=Helicobacter sp. MIT 05-5294 TaxID=1548150 RepID=UPI000B26CD62|nr:RDD family protein [Helicobacter sp. MIT 05-5294]TLD89239.1 RDD family protein [Helicobacter sp. MIT 05-5294]
MRWRKVKQNPQSPTHSNNKQQNFHDKLPQKLPDKLLQELAHKSDSTQRIPLQIAGFLERGKAQIIDTFMIYLPIMYLITYGVLGSKEALWESPWAPSVAILLYGIIAAVFIAKSGQTPGKKAYSLWIVRENGKNVTFLFALLRFFVFLVSGASIAGIFMPLWRKDKKALHDILLKTLVLKKG